jgi:hypothetical protein
MVVSHSERFFRRSTNKFIYLTEYKGTGSIRWTLFKGEENKFALKFVYVRDYSYLCFQVLITNDVLVRQSIARCTGKVGGVRVSFT